MVNYVQNAIIAVTYRCNSRCITCNIWKKKKTKEVPPSFYTKLPASLKDINLTGGEPFLRIDLPEIVEVIKKTCPKARIIINTNGLLTKRIVTMSKAIIKIDSKIAFRVSLDGWGEVHDSIRGIKGSFQRATKTLEKLANIQVKDLGISFTLTNNNKNQLLKLYKFTKDNNLQFSLTITTDSEIYFGKGKEKLRPKITKTTNQNLFLLEKEYYQALQPKDWLRGWFTNSLKQYLKTRKRPFPCLAGKSFFYLDPQGDVFTCHLKNWFLGNLIDQSFNKIWSSQKRKEYQKYVNKCHDCWMICTAKNSMQNNWWKILPKVILSKIVKTDHE